MGQSSDAIICYGIDLGEDLPWEDFDDECEDEEAEKLRNPLGWMAYYGKAIDGVSLVAHCCEQDQMFILAIAGSEIARACLGAPVKIPELKTQAFWDAMLAKFMAAHGIESDNKPAWLLASERA